MTTEQKNMELMQTLDDAWNAQDWDRMREERGRGVPSRRVTSARDRSHTSLGRPRSWLLGPDGAHIAGRYAHCE